MMTMREMQDAQAALSAELDSFGETLSALRAHQESTATWVATLIRVLADAGVVSRLHGPFAALLRPADQPCLFCGQEH